MAPDEQVRQAVQRALRRDPRLENADIQVVVEGGVVRLTGTLSSYARRYAAAQAVHRVAGVLDVVNEIQVELPPATVRGDTDLAHAVRHALEWDVEVPDQRIVSTVTAGWVTLEGTVDARHEREDAERAIRHLVGVRGVSNNIAFRTPKVQPDVIRRQIAKALERRADELADRIEIVVRGGTVTLAGRVHSLAERDAVLVAARVTPGVEKVDNELQIVPDSSVPFSTV